MKLISLKRKIKRLGFELSKFNKDKYHKKVDLEFMEIRGRYSNLGIPSKLKKQGSEDSVWTADGHVIIGIDDYLGQIKSIQQAQEIISLNRK